MDNWNEQTVFSGSLLCPSFHNQGISCLNASTSTNSDLNEHAPEVKEPNAFRSKGEQIDIGPHEWWLSLHWISLLGHDGHQRTV